MNKNNKNVVQDNPVYNIFTVIDDPTCLFNDGAIFDASQILGFRDSEIVGQCELPEGIEMLYKKRGKTIYRCQYYNNELHVIAKN